MTQTGPVISFRPIIIITILFGLSMDYEVFLVSGMRESYSRGAAPTPAVVGGFRRGARVVTAAAIIMMSVFAGFISVTTPPSSPSVSPSRSACSSTPSWCA